MNKTKKNFFALLGILLSLATAVLYAVFYGKTQSSMDNMSWIAFGLLIGGGVVGLILYKLHSSWAPRVMGVCHLLALCYTIYQMYPYISAAFVGIDSTWEVPFFVVMGMLVAGLVVNAFAVGRSLPGTAKLAKVCMNLTAILWPWS